MKKLMALAGTLSIAATEAFAQSTGGNLQPVQSTLQQLVSVFTGSIATALATLAVIACGLFAWGGRLTWGIAVLAAWHAVWDDVESYYFERVCPPRSFDLVIQN
ncbi:TrbC/VirB2 family protein [Xanthobacter sp. TB0139]|uniref:TrbC/VirB2 family protein n=1 Tax=Xanthobacter sp. TB0139 TaxID=3459178 RepID=UPI004039FC42